VAALIKITDLSTLGYNIALLILLITMIIFLKHHLFLLTNLRTNQA
jgi:hypothetical protein